MSHLKDSRSAFDADAQSHDKRALDFDPEDISEHDEPSDDESASGSSVAHEDGERAHYEVVGKSKLRPSEEIILGPQYQGSFVKRRDALEEESDNPFEQDGDDAFSTSEDEESGSNAIGNDDDDESSITSDEESMDMQKRTDEEDDIDRDELRRIMTQERKTIAASISEAAKSDIEKGKAVKEQRKAFDSLLNVRIRLQKTLISSNSLAAVRAEDPTLEAPQDVVASAEKAAFNLWNSLNTLRDDLQKSREDTNQTRPEFTVKTSSKRLWSEMQAKDDSERPHRRAVLDKWSAKSRSASNVLASSKGQLSGAKEQSLSDLLSAQLLDSTRLVKRTRMARSCAPMQARAGVHESEDVYDDADFYGLMLKELLEQRGDALKGGSDFTFGTPWQAAREAKTKKIVDTKASKGRKLRYTVHEKLQNFMAPEDRGTWEERQINELFGSLFGKRLDLSEANDGDPDLEPHETEAEEQSLLLFRS